MGPIDKVRARTAALEELGVDVDAGPDEIREAWRRVAFQAHPDHSGGDNEDFARAKAAYDVLRKEGLAGSAHCARNVPPKPRRPKIEVRVIEFSVEEMATCQALLDANVVSLDNLSFVDADGLKEKPAQPAARDGAPKDHVAIAVRCHGRHLTYIVASTAEAGINRVALPASVLEHARRAKPKIVVFRCPKAGTGEVTLPATIQSQMFPGARQVSIRFQSGVGQS
ncbi:J domain-containing protein [Ruegeria sediminis]|uniref:J domain-containing protein n=1 Tax=Ruegeria sediminis TaxID=2583820 RepID=A0ABY2X311_9RHOB|nr:J domain-containing protein [Ruegeria sediminis]TMV09771.1 J domain-containing protein [Ruegeria sediminis]